MTATPASKPVYNCYYRVTVSGILVHQGRHFLEADAFDAAAQKLGYDCWGHALEMDSSISDKIGIVNHGAARGVLWMYTNSAGELCSYTQAEDDALRAAVARDAEILSQMSSRPDEPIGGPGGD